MCVAAEWNDQRLQFTAFDPLKGRGRVVAQAALGPGALSDWDLSRDGKWIALALHTDGPARVRILPCSAGSPRDVSFPEWPYLRTINWRADDSGWFGSTRSGAEVVLLTMEKTGVSRILWKAATSFFPWAIPALGGKRLAFPVYTSHFEAWLMENF